MLLLEIDFQSEKIKEEFFIYSENTFFNFNIGDIIYLDFDKLIVNESYGVNDFKKFKEKIYSKATIKKTYCLDNRVPNFNNQDIFFTSKYYIIEWDGGDLMHINEDELGKFVKYI